MQSFKRTDRANSVIREALSRILLLEVRDPVARGATVTYVKVSADFSLARVNVRCLEDTPEARKTLLAALRKASGFLRSRLAEEVNLFKTPQLVFHYDDAPDTQAKIELLLSDIARQATAPAQSPDPGFDKEHAFEPDDD
ncbi:MAG TPA: 30S ribosome-binding factor RbfA [Myxococcota bacterium]|nr:30S ribosome-binding factor RbfA [Myxococcota bacterium]HQP95213.1 30S ribosome-binding factor RbfA [Myxococcota bacterium]